jgi:hypothetical protein
MRRCNIGSVENVQDTGLGGGIRGSLRHLPMRVHLPAIDRQPKRADQQDAHGHHEQDDSLSLLAAGCESSTFQNTMIPCVALPRRNVCEKYVVSGSYG